MSKLFINKNIWNTFNESEMSNYVDSVFNYYRSVGFPYFSKCGDYRDKEFMKFMNFDSSNIVDDYIIKQTMHGLGFLWSFHPHSFSVKCNDKLSPFEAFNDDEIFRKVIMKRIQFGDNISDNGIRKMLKMYSGVQGVSNFRPTAAEGIYKHLLPNGGVTWDMSCGYGGRLLGAHKAGIKYIGTDPALDTHKGNELMASFIGSDAELHNVGSEVFKPIPNSLDLCFTSPPYFNCEKYSNEETQSYMKYKSKNDWMNGFMLTTLENCFNGLRVGGILAVNIANIKTYTTIERDFRHIAMKVGFKPISGMKLNLSAVMGKVGFKEEPVYLFIKPRKTLL
jgi:hypothetical protein